MVAPYVFEGSHCHAATTIVDESRMSWESFAKDASVQLWSRKNGTSVRDKDMIFISQLLNETSFVKSLFLGARSPSLAAASFSPKTAPCRAAATSFSLSQYGPLSSTSCLGTYKFVRYPVSPPSLLSAHLATSAMRLLFASVKSCRIGGPLWLWCTLHSLRSTRLSRRKVLHWSPRPLPTSRL